MKGVYTYLGLKTEGNESMSRGTERTPGWIVLETFSDDHPSVVFEGTPRVFKPLTRRRNFNSSAVTEKILKTVRSVQNGAHAEDARAALPDGTDVLIRALPVLGPDGVYGSQVWLGEYGQPVGEPRTVEAYSFDPVTCLTHHGPGVDRNILSIDPIEAKRPSHHQIFEFYDDFSKQSDVGEYVETLVTDAPPNGDRRFFDADICLTDGRGIGRTIHVSMGYAPDALGRPEAKGILHDVTDHVPHRVDYALAMAKKLAAQDHPAMGRAIIDLTTGIALQWLNPPIGALTPWLTDLPEFTEQGREAATNLRKRVLARSVYAEFTTPIRFTGTGDWIDARIGFEHYGENQGLMTVREN